jgi:hypothetical protein
MAVKRRTNSNGVARSLPIWRRSPVAQRIATPCVEIPASRAPDVAPGPRRIAARGHSGRHWAHAGLRVGERPHGPERTASRSAAEAGASRWTLPQSTGRRRLQIFSQMFSMHARRSKRAEPERGKRKIARRTLPSRQVRISNARVLHEPHCMPPLREYSIPERVGERKRQSAFCAHIAGNFAVLPLRSTMTTPCTG